MSILSVKGGDIETRKKRHAHKEDSQNKERHERSAHDRRREHSWVEAARTIGTPRLSKKKESATWKLNNRCWMQQSDRGKIRHRRHVWQTHYGRGMSRIPRKVMSRRGTQFNWEGSGVPFSKGGPRAHPPKILAHKNTKKINKKELVVAMNSAISATANKKLIAKRYSTIDKNVI